MHQSAFDAMKALVGSHVPTDRELVVVEVGSRQPRDAPLSHRALFDEPRCSFVGVDLNEGHNVDVVMSAPYCLPLPDASADVIVCGQVFEHIPFFWVTMMEFARVIADDGVILVSAPSRGHVHYRPFDGWRFYEDGYRALADFAGLDCIEVRTDYPTITPGTGRFDYAAPMSYWGDTAGAFRRSCSYRRIGIDPVRRVLISWANARADAPSDPGRQSVGTRARRTLGRIRRRVLQRI